MSSRYSTIWDPYGSCTTGLTKTDPANPFLNTRTSKNHSEALCQSTTSYFGKREKLKPQLRLTVWLELVVNSSGLSVWFPGFTFSKVGCFAVETLTLFLN